MGKNLDRVQPYKCYHWLCHKRKLLGLFCLRVVLQNLLYKEICSAEMVCHLLPFPMDFNKILAVELQLQNRLCHLTSSISYHQKYHHDRFL